MVPENIKKQIQERYPLHILPLSGKDAAENMFAELYHAGAEYGYSLAQQEMSDRNDYYENKIEILNRIGIEKDQEIERLKGLIEKCFKEDVI